MPGPDPATRRSLRRWLTPAVGIVAGVIALSAWALSSPVGSAPDDDYHLVSTWCAWGKSAGCEPGVSADTRLVSPIFKSATCYVQVSEASGACQSLPPLGSQRPFVETSRGNFANEYPAVFYGTMRVFAGESLAGGAIAMRLVNAGLFVAIAATLLWLLPRERRAGALWGWLISLVPLGMFIIPSNNPSSWAVTGVGAAFLGMCGWWETSGRRSWALAALALLGVVLAAGARGDAAVYAVGAIAVAAILAGQWSRDAWRRWLLPAAGVALALALLATSHQAGVGAHGFSGGGTGDVTGAAGDAADQVGGIALAAYNLLMLPYLWTGVWGTWGLGWLDTPLPAIVPWAAAAAFIVVAFAGLAVMTRRKAIALAGVIGALVVIPVYVLTRGGDKVGAELQPRYLLPVILLAALAAVTLPRGARRLPLTRLQTALALGGLAAAHSVALYVNLRRYVTGIDVQGASLDAGAEWWWPGAPVGPTAVWLTGTIAFCVVVAVAWPVLRGRRQTTE